MAGNRSRLKKKTLNDRQSDFFTIVIWVKHWRYWFVLSTENANYPMLRVRIRSYTNDFFFPLNSRDLHFGNICWSATKFSQYILNLKMK